MAVSKKSITTTIASGIIKTLEWLFITSKNTKALNNPGPMVVVKDLADSASHLAIRPWSKNEDFGEVSSDILENCKKAFDKKGIIIQPFVRENSN